MVGLVNDLTKLKEEMFGDQHRGGSAPVTGAELTQNWEEEDAHTLQLQAALLCILHDEFGPLVWSPCSSSTLNQLR